MNVRNHIHLTGNLGAAPSTVTLKSGTQATEFNLATNEYYRDREGNRKTRTEWHRVKAYGKLAEVFTEYLAKGSQISLIGSVRYRRWTDKYEQTRVTAEVIAEEFTFLDKLSSAEKGEEASEPTATKNVPTAANAPQRRIKRGHVTEVAV